MFRHALLLMLVYCGVPALAQDQPQIATYAGRLAPLRVADDEAVPKGFRITWFAPSLAVGAADAIFVVEEDLHALPWFLRAGFVPPAGPGGPIIGYQLDDRAQLVELPRLVMSDLPTKSADDLSHEVSAATIDGRKCRVFKGVLPSGRPARVAVDAATGQLVRYKGTIVIGRGDRFELTLELEESKKLSDAESSKLKSLAKRIESLLPDVSEAADPIAAAIPKSLLETIHEQRKELIAAARKTPYQKFVSDILRDVDERRQSQQRILAIAKKLIGSPAPALPAKRLDGTPFDLARLKGKTVVLHFWHYDMEPLTAPFGQVGPLDFLARKYGEQDVAAIGIAVDPNFAKPAASQAAMHSSRRFAEFMNLDYPLCRDNGSLLRKYGDPLSLGAELPLWVVIDPQGKVGFYRTGLFEQRKPGEGLKVLEAAVAEQQDP